ncbi:MAG: putative toxin-antitoxin system toxin component, PIN family [Gemmatimonadota bacterium]
MRRVVLDANVIVSAFLRPEGPSGQILRRWFEASAFEVILSPALMAEIRRALGYPSARPRIVLSDRELEQRLQMLEPLAESVEDRHPAGSICADPDDDKYLLAAREGRASLIVTGDRHLLAIEAFEGVHIVGPREFLDLLTIQARD